MSTPARVIFSMRQPRSLTMIDFEIMQAVGGKVTEEIPELQAIFGREEIGEGRQRHAGG